MAEDVGIEGDVKNKSGMRIGVTRMSLKNTLKDVMCQIIGHRNPSSIDR